MEKQTWPPVTPMEMSILSERVTMSILASASGSVAAWESVAAE